MFANLTRLGFISSPPQGSPKPMTRNRKNKPAPVPPTNPPSKEPAGKEAIRDSVVFSKEPRINCDESSHAATAPEPEVLLGFERLLVAEKKSEVEISEKLLESEKRDVEEEKKIQCEPVPVIQTIQTDVPTEK